MTINEKFEKAMDLLERVAQRDSYPAPDTTWFRDMYLLTGEHMIRTEDGWEPGEGKAELVEEYGEDVVIDEVNAPEYPRRHVEFYFEAV